ncbi:hypothetical protein F0562_031371 [Nyssa sinensis]|uniref:beta-fructofuranosidase n=1 Tax=Nyssa sinensis TaxID=561372 RepID=A0A5J5AUA3_9ASTE|nr:hypothetical protein F0562_031371 [Nyssa sinensis]
MESHHSHTTHDDLEHAASYTPLAGQPETGISPAGQKPPVKVDREEPESLPSQSILPKTLNPPSRGVSEGVSEKTFRDFSGYGDFYPWTNDMLSWQRTSYHFQPEKNWMNDPNGPLFYKGWYHFFYQYNPDAAVWGNITWGHAVSRDLIHWLYLPFAMVPDRWYDLNGVWTGSATILPDGQIVMLYTGDTVDSVQVQNLAYPANLSDPLLLDWVKYSGNPVLVPPPGIGSDDFRDPTTAWQGPDGKWRVMIGSKSNTTGISLVYQTSNFTSYELLEGVLHAVPHTGQVWTDNKHDYYALGTYDPITVSWTPDNPEMDVGTGLRVDYGKYYASKTFYDQTKRRRILWGWTAETDYEGVDLLKAWSSVQTIPRTVVFDKKTGTNLLYWPVEEVESLRLNCTEFDEVEVGPGTVVPLNISSATQLDITATFEIDNATLEATVEADMQYNCTGGAIARSALGPFGILVLADDSLSELTPIYFYIAKDSDGSTKNWFCADEMRSSKASDVYRRIYGSVVPVLDGEKFSLRILVDHSIVESFAQGGRSVITSRVYPTKAIYSSARVFLFNNATGLKVTASVKIWEMNSAYNHPFPLGQM